MFSPEFLDFYLKYMAALVVLLVAFGVSNFAFAVLVEHLKERFSRKTRSHR